MGGQGNRKSRFMKHDGKLGWVVVIGAFFAHVITHGIVYSFGMMFSSVEVMFHASKAEIAWIPSIMSGSLYLIGCGFGMIFLSAIVIVTQYFIKYRAIACGIGLSGAGVGAFIFSPLIERLLTVYGWHGTLLITSGLILNCIVAAFAFKTMEIQDVKNPENGTDVCQVCEESFTDFPSHTCDIMCDDKRYIKDVMYDGKTDAHGVMYDVKQDSNLDNDHTLDKLLDNHQSDDIDKRVVKTGLMNSSINNEHNEATITVEIVKTGEINRAETKFGAKDKKHLLKSLIARQISLLKNIEFVAFILSQFLYFVGFYLPFIYIPGKANLSGIHEDKIAWIGSTIGLSSVLGRIILGYIADRTNVDRYVMFKISLLIAGISTSFGPLLESYWTFMLYAVIYGLSTGITLSLTSVVLVDLVGIHLLPDAMGLNNLLSGFGSLLGPPIAGLLYDKTKSYTATFLAPGIAITISGIMLVITGCKRRKINAQLKN
ncbi:hypothetical protein ACF0H5_020598 [Mactra antiquata]